MSEHHFSCKSNTLTNKHQLSANFHPLTETYCRGCCHCCCSHCHASSLSNYLWSQAWGWLVLQGRQYHAVSINSSLKIRKGASIHHPISKHLYLYTKIAHLSLPWSIGWVAISFLVRCRRRCPAMVTPVQISLLVAPHPKTHTFSESLW